MDLNLTAINNTLEVTMTSLEIAKETGKKHGNVCRDIRKILVSLGLPEINYEVGYLDANGQKRTMYKLDEKTLLCLISGYNIEIRMRIIDRWKELEDQAQSNVVALPDFTNPVVAAHAWADQYEQKLIAQQETKQEKFMKIQKVLDLRYTDKDSLIKFLNENKVKTMKEVSELLGAHRATVSLYLKKNLHIDDNFISDYKKGRYKEYIGMFNFELLNDDEELGLEKFKVCNEYLPTTARGRVLVSNYGRVAQESFYTVDDKVESSFNLCLIDKVNIYGNDYSRFRYTDEDNNQQRTQVSLMVARCFLDCSTCNTLSTKHLDGDNFNNKVYNIAWRGLV